ncbi:unnamed protein product [Euphydryas editha]|uniref:DUF5641 domain-containing protein n=1 Tax=Euphydryas editha TaxID=104508 RepID=A0AAU9UHV4_EUPED|nr:unnamed protein product [Euphydryas editha]
MDGLVNVLKDLQNVITKGFTNFKKCSKDKLTVEYIETRQELLEKDWSLFKDTNTKIYESFKIENIGQKVVDIYDAVEDTYIMYKSHMKTTLNKIRVSKGPIQGTVHTENMETPQNINVMHAQVKEDDVLKRFWEIEEQNSPNKILTPEKKKCEEFYSSTTRRGKSRFKLRKWNSNNQEIVQKIRSTECSEVQINKLRTNNDIHKDIDIKEHPKMHKIDYNRPNYSNEVNVDMEDSVKTYVALVPESSLFERFSTLTKLIRIVAYCRRFLKQNKIYHGLYLQKVELDVTLESCIRQTQKEFFLKSYIQLKDKGFLQLKSSSLKSLCPYRDAKGIIRVAGRLEKSHLNEQMKHPILLPHASHLTRLIIDDAHKKTLHGGLQYKWSYKVPEPKIGDIVLIKEDNLPPSRWLLGRILEKHPGDDGITRVVTLRTKSSTIKRPTSKICILPVAE